MNWHPKGRILCEFAMGSTALPQHFRNPVVSGMGVGLRVLESAQYSGSAITSRLAIDQGQGGLRGAGQYRVEDELGT
jgi:DNA processing protein